jgi:hypothetical protein
MDRGKNLSQSTKRVILREGKLICALEFIFGRAQGISDLNFSPTLCFRYVTSQTFRSDRQDSCICSKWTANHGRFTLNRAFVACFEKTNREHLDRIFESLRPATPWKTDVLVDSAANRAMLE